MGFRISCGCIFHNEKFCMYCIEILWEKIEAVATHGRSTSLSNDINFLFYMLMIFAKSLVKLDIVWLSEKNIGLKPWDGGSTEHAPCTFKPIKL
jgi:hypothetical protein